jgi:hypothetical protein
MKISRSDRVSWIFINIIELGLLNHRNSNSIHELQVMYEISAREAEKLSDLIHIAYMQQQIELALDCEEIT